MGERAYELGIPCGVWYTLVARTRASSRFSLQPLALSSAVADQSTSGAASRLEVLREVICNSCGLIAPSNQERDRKSIKWT